MNTDTLCIPFGKHKGKLVSELPSSYLKWLAENCENDEICEAADAEYRWRQDNNAHFEE